MCQGVQWDPRGPLSQRPCFVRKACVSSFSVRFVSLCVRTFCKLHCLTAVLTRAVPWLGKLGAPGVVVVDRQKHVDVVEHHLIRACSVSLE